MIFIREAIGIVVPNPDRRWSNRELEGKLLEITSFENSFKEFCYKKKQNKAVARLGGGQEVWYIKCIHIISECRALTLNYRPGESYLFVKIMT